LCREKQKKMRADSAFCRAREPTLCRVRLSLSREQSSR
jgi:hypothetical protein